MTELIRKLREKVEARIGPHVEMYGDDAPVVKMARLILQDAETIDEELSQEWVTTQEAVDRTGWVAETLQRQARTVLAGGALTKSWQGLQVRDTTNGYLFLIGSIPTNPRAARAS